MTNPTLREELLDLLDKSKDNDGWIRASDLSIILACHLFDIEAVEVEWGVRWVDDPDHIQRLPKDRVDRKASRAYGDIIYRRTRTTYCDRVTEWEEVDG